MAKLRRAEDRVVLGRSHVALPKGLGELVLPGDTHIQHYPSAFFRVFAFCLSTHVPRAWRGVAGRGFGAAPSHPNMRSEGNTRDLR